MKRLFFIPLIAALGLLAIPSTASAQAEGQTYTTGIGVKFGYWAGGALDIKHFLKPAAALEGELAFGPDWFMITGLYEFHHQIANAPGLQWYIGPGAHVGFWNTNYINHHHGMGGSFFGIDGVLGLDYKFNKVPIDLSLDVQPEYSFPNDAGFGFWGGLGVRYTF